MKKNKSLKQRWSHFLRHDAKQMAITLLLLFAFRSAIADWNDVPTGSMKPTIMEGDRVFVNKLAYDLKVPFTQWHIAEWDNPHRGEIVVFFSPADGQRLVKRVIGLPGDVIEMRNDRLLVNGQPVAYDPLPSKFSNELPITEQPQHQFATEELDGRPHPVMATPANNALRTFGPVIVPEGKYFMMGDNRDDSFDSRYYGSVDRSAIVGRVPAVVISMDRHDYYLPRWHRTFTKLP